MGKQQYIFKKQIITIGILLIFIILGLIYNVAFKIKIALLLYSFIVLGITFIPSIPRILKYPYWLHLLLYEFPFLLSVFLLPQHKNSLFNYYTLSIAILAILAVIFLLFVGKKYYIKKIKLAELGIPINRSDSLFGLFRVFYQCTVEEICFRGFFVGYLCIELGVWTVIISALLFCFTHYLNRWANKKFNTRIYGLQFLLGIILGSTFYVTQSLFIVIICHLVFNSSEVIVLFKQLKLSVNRVESFFDDY